MATILIVEDEKNIQRLIQAQLKPYYTILTADNGAEALEIIESKHIDLLITDVMMPKMDGFELVNEVRNDGFEFPILMLTAKQEIQDKRKGFGNGADDYLTKPINYEELLLRIDALLRRYKIITNKKLTVGEAILDEETYTVSKGTNVIELSKKEFALLYKFLGYPNQVFTKNQLLDEIWGFDSFSGEETLKTHISRLRKKCGDFSEFKIITVKGLGYKGVLYV